MLQNPVMSQISSVPSSGQRGRRIHPVTTGITAATRVHPIGLIGIGDLLKCCVTGHGVITSGWIRRVHKAVSLVMSWNKAQDRLEIKMCSYTTAVWLVCSVANFNVVHVVNTGMTLGSELELYKLTSLIWLHPIHFRPRVVNNSYSNKSFLKYSAVIWVT